MPNCNLPLCCKVKPVIILFSLPPVDIFISGFHAAAAAALFIF